MTATEALARRVVAKRRVSGPNRLQRESAAFILLMAALSLAPFVYGWVAFQGDWSRLSRAPVPGHVALNVAANALTVAGAVSASGRLDRRIAGVFGRTVAVHGALAMIVLLTRQWYSVPMLFTGIFVSSGLGIALVFFTQHGLRPRIGLIGRRHAIGVDPTFVSERLVNPDARVSQLDVIVITSDGPISPAWQPTLARALLAGKRVRHVKEYLEEVEGRVTVEDFAFAHLPPGGLTSYRIRKRVIDLLGGALVAPVALPLIAMGALAVLFTMGRPILYLQPRVGLGGRAFNMIKLRSMRAESPSDGDNVGAGGLTTALGDARITPVGAFLRRFHIDELPQLWNILHGDMSLIGPRPEQPQLVKAYQAQAPSYAFRHLVRPGITGWAQINSGYAADFSENRVKLAYDLFYVKHFSFSLDLEIVLRTVLLVLKGGDAR